MNPHAFATLPLSAPLLNNLASLGYHAMTPIQSQSLPAILDGRDVIGQGKTGSGKTAAFGLGLLHRLEVKHFRVQALVLCPTRELADQVAQEIRRLGRTVHNIKVLTLCGGAPLGPQIGSLEHGAHIVVGTPGRIEEHLHKGTLRLDGLTALVLDEADRMLDMGFQPALEAILEWVPERRQTLLFSATFPEQIQNIARRVMANPVVAQVESRHDADSIEQSFHRVAHNEERFTALLRLLAQHQPASTVVFCNTKQQTQELAEALASQGYSASALNGDLDQRARDQALVTFAHGSVSILVATDVAARGLDIDGLDAVINYQMARDAEIHVHRIGRTGRAGGKGIACTLFSDREGHKLAALEAYLDAVFEPQPLPPAYYSDVPAFEAEMATLQIDGGKKQKIRPGDILGALTGAQGIEGSEVGKITIFDQCAYVAVRRVAVNRALAKLKGGKLKGRSVRVRIIRAG